MELGDDQLGDDPVIGAAEVLGYILGRSGAGLLGEAESMLASPVACPGKALSTPTRNTSTAETTLNGKTIVIVTVLALSPFLATQSCLSFHDEYRSWSVSCDSVFF